MHRTMRRDLVDSPRRRLNCRGIPLRVTYEAPERLVGVLQAPEVGELPHPPQTISVGRPGKMPPGDRASSMTFISGLGLPRR